MTYLEKQPESLLEQARKYIQPKDIQVVMYHDRCPDGYASAFAAWKLLGDSISYIPLRHENPNFDFVLLENKHVILIDFALSLPQLLKARSIAKKIAILDHHLTAKQHLANTEGVFIELNCCGSMLAWQYFHPFSPIPKFLALVQDRDLGLWQIPDAMPFSAKLLHEIHHTPNFDFRSFDALLDTSAITKFLTDGQTLLLHQAIKINAMLEQQNTVIKSFNFNNINYKIGLLELKEQYLSNEITHNFLNRHALDFAVSWYQLKQTPTQLYKVSLRAKVGGVDVSVIAKSFGGGGHPYASGLVTNILPTILFD